MAGIGPDSFTIGNGGQVVLQQSNTAAAPQTQLSGASGGVTIGGQVSLAPGGEFQRAAELASKTIGALNKLTDGLLQPHIEAEQKKMYYEGMSKVAQGQALMDVEAEQPWYTRIFGPSATVRGAQAMTAQTALTQAQADFMQEMPQLRSQSPDQVRQYLVQKAAGVGQTGDPMVDAMVQAKMAEQWGPMLTTHMKEHLAWQQEDMLKKQTNLGISVGEKLKADRASASLTGWDEEAKKNAYADAVESARPAYGQPPESWNKSIADTLTANLIAGNFDYYNAIRDSELWHQIDPMQRTKLEASLPVYVQKAAISNPNTTNLYTSMEGLEFNLQHGMSGLSHAQLDRVLDGYNSGLSATTGARSPMLNNQQRANLHKMLEAGNLAAQKRLDAVNSEQAEYINAQTEVATAWNAGRADVLKGLKIPERAAMDMVNTIFKTEVGSGDQQRVQTFFDKAAQVAREDKLRSTELENTLRTQLIPLVSGNGPATPSMQAALQYASMLYHTPGGGADALGHYMGADDAAKVIALLQSGVDINDEKQLVQQREVIAKGRGAIVTQDDKDAALNAVKKADPGWFKRMFGAGELTPFDLNQGNKDALYALITPKVAEYRKAYHMSAEDAAPLVLSSVLKHADVLPGGFVLHNPAVRGDGSLAAAVNRMEPGLAAQSTTFYQGAAKEFIGQKLKAALMKAGADLRNFDPDDWEIRSGNQLGNGELRLFLSNPDYPGLQMVSVGAGTSKDDPEGFTYFLKSNRGKDYAAGYGPSNTFLTKDRMSKADKAMKNGWGQYPWEAPRK